MTIEEEIGQALSAPEPFLRLRDVAARWIAGGTDRDEVCARFESYREQMRAAGREVDEDVVLEVMDCVVGWCSPHMRIPEE